MRLYVVRHAVAIERGGAVPDGSRWLTADGRRRFRRAAKRFAKTVEPPEAIYTSPLVRATQTAELLAQALSFDGAVEVWGELAGGTVRAVMSRLSALDADRTIALVGHEPQCSELCAALLGRRDFPLKFPKGGIAALALRRRGVKLEGRFQWLLAPKSRRFVDLEGRQLKRPT